MAIRINSNTPQQTKASAATFGYTQPRRSALSDVGQVLGGVAQSSASLISHMQRKEDEANKIVAQKAIDGYTADYTVAAGEYTEALKGSDQELIASKRQAYNELDPNSKNFSANFQERYADKAIDQKYYERAFGDFKIGWARDNVTFKNTENQFTIVNTEKQRVETATKEFGKLMQQDSVGTVQFDTYLNTLIANGSSTSIDALTSAQVKNDLRAGYSNLIVRAYDELGFAKANTPEELKQYRDDFYRRLENENLVKFFKNEGGVDSAYTKRLNALTTGNNNAIKAKIKNNLNVVTNLGEQLLTTLDNLNDAQGVQMMKDFSVGVESIQGVKNYLEEGSLEQRTFNSLTEVQALFKAVPSEDGDTEIMPFQQHVIASVLDADYDPALSLDMTRSHQQLYRAKVTALSTDIKDALKENDATEVYELMFGRQAMINSVPDVKSWVENTFKRKTGGLLVTPTADFPSNWYLEGSEEQLGRYLGELLLYNDPKTIMTASVGKMRSSKVGVQNEGAILQLVGGYLFNNPQSSLADLELFTKQLSRNYNLGLGADTDAEDFKAIRKVAFDQSEEYQLELVKLINSYPTNSPLRAFFSTTLNGYIQNQVDNYKADGIPIIQNNEATRAYNNIVSIDGDNIAKNIGYRTETKNGTNIVLFGDILDTVEIERKKVAGLIPERLIGGTTMFKNIVGRTGIGGSFDQRKQYAADVAYDVQRALVYEIIDSDQFEFKTMIDFENLPEDNPFKYAPKELKKSIKEYNKGDIDKYELYRELLTAQVNGVPFLDFSSKSTHADSNQLGYDVRYYRSNIAGYDSVSIPASEEGLTTKYVIPFDSVNARALEALKKKLGFAMPADKGARPLTFEIPNILVSSLFNVVSDEEFFEMQEAKKNLSE